LHSRVYNRVLTCSVERADGYRCFSHYLWVHLLVVQVDEIPQAPRERMTA